MPKLEILPKTSLRHAVRATSTIEIDVIYQLLSAHDLRPRSRLTHPSPPHSKGATILKGRSVTDPDPAERMAQLEARIDKLKSKDAPKPHQEEHYSQAQQAWRMVIELVAGLGIGFGMGYGLDSLLGTLPIFLVILTLLGLAAGIKTMMRSAAEIQQANESAPHGAEDKRATDGD